MELRICPFTPCDFPGVMDVLSASFPEEMDFWGITQTQAEGLLFFYRLATVLQKLTGPRFKFFVAKLGEEVVGTAMIERRKNFAYLEAVAVHPEHRGKGYARALVSRAIEEAFSWGPDRVVLRVREDNFPAKNLYLSLGFVPFERIATLVWEEGNPGPLAPLPSGYRLVRVGENGPRVDELLEKTREPKAREVYGPPERPSILLRVLSVMFGGTEERALVVKGRAPVGIYYLGKRTSSAVRVRVEILPEFQGQGLEESLLSRAVHQAQSLRRKAVLQASTERDELIKAALKVGFQKAFVEESMVLFRGKR
ncbi:GNAT family N-acetyltransferase [Candidatus Bipolaricaulota bacterium]|nr:GNAT family N-acetyltransferase [Candidatus Bipolaricaulota bacterium]